MDLRSGNTRSKFLGVRQRPSGKWVAEIKNTTKKIRMWLGTFNTPEEAARAYDEAACLLRGSNTRTNFSPIHRVSTNSPLSVKIRNLLHQKHKQNPPPQTTNEASRACTTLLTSTSTDWSFDQDAKSPSSSVVSQDTQVQVLNDAYRPDLSNCQPGSTQLCAFPTRFDQPPMTPDHNHQGMEMQVSEFNEAYITELEHMRVETQISASLSAINEVNEYLENAYLTSDALWDFSGLLNLPNLFCQTL